MLLLQVLGTEMDSWIVLGAGLGQSPKPQRVNFGGGMEMRLNMPAGRASRSQVGCGAVASAGCPAWLSAQGSAPPGLTQPKIFFQ